MSIEQRRRSRKARASPRIYATYVELIGNRLRKMHGAGLPSHRISYLMREGDREIRPKERLVFSEDIYRLRALTYHSV